MESVIDGLHWKRVVSFVSWNLHSAITLVQWRKAVIRRGLLNTLGWIWRKLKRLEEVENHASMTGWQKLFFSYKMLLTFGGRYNCYFWDTRLKILRLLNFNFLASRGFSRRGVFVFTKSWSRGFIKGRATGKLTGCEHDFAQLLYISKNFFLIQGTIINSFKLQSCPILDESYRV